MAGQINLYLNWYCLWLRYSFLHGLDGRDRQRCKAETILIDTATLVILARLFVPG